MKLISIRTSVIPRKEYTAMQNGRPYFPDAIAPGEFTIYGMFPEPQDIVYEDYVSLLEDFSRDMHGKRWTVRSLNTRHRRAEGRASSLDSIGKRGRLRYHEIGRIAEGGLVRLSYSLHGDHVVAHVVFMEKRKGHEKRVVPCALKVYPGGESLFSWNDSVYLAPNNIVRALSL